MFTLNTNLSTTAVSYDDANYWTYVHQVMLADEVRMKRFQQALTSVIRPGDVVADIGTGTGILALLAYRAGAARVYAIDHNPAALWLANRIIRANEAENYVHTVEGDARFVTLPESVDVIICEMIGTLGTDEGIYEAVQTFANQHLKQGGRVIPERLQTYLAPVEYRQEFRGVWQQEYMGLDLRSAINFPSCSQPLLHFLRRRPVELGHPLLLEDLSLGNGTENRPDQVSGCVEVVHPGTLQGFVGYFVATLSGNVTLSNYPCYPGCNWSTWNWSVSPPLTVSSGQIIQTTLVIDKDKDSLSWNLRWEV